MPLGRWATRPAGERHQLRVIDESGEDYLYPEEYFVPVTPSGREGRTARCSWSYFHSRIS